MTQSRRSPVFHPAATLLLWASLIAAALMGWHLWPMVDVDIGYQAIDVGIPADYPSMLFLFVLSVLTAAMILAWRAWALYLRAWWRSR